MNLNAPLMNVIPDMLVSPNAIESEPLFEPHLYYDYIALLNIGISAVTGTVWWIITWFVYIKSTGNDPDLILNNKIVLPIEWFWHNLPNITVGWMAASELATFVAYMFVSFVEIFAWISYAYGYNLMMRYWIEFTYYTFIWYAPAWIFALVEMTATKEAGGLAGEAYAEYMTNSTFLFLVGLILWAYIGLIHLWYVPRLMDHIDTVNSVCKCDIIYPSVENIGTKAREYTEALAKAECLRKCPPPDVLAQLKETNIIVAGAGAADAEDAEDDGFNSDDKW